MEDDSVDMEDGLKDDIIDMGDDSIDIEDGSIDMGYLVNMMPALPPSHASEQSVYCSQQSQQSRPIVDARGEGSCRTYRNVASSA